MPPKLQPTDNSKKTISDTLDGKVYAVADENDNDNSEKSSAQWTPISSNEGLVNVGEFNKNFRENIKYLQESPEVQALVESGIITYSDGVIIWRTGHLEHIANLYKGDPVTTERNYADDLLVARMYSAEVWAELIK